MNTMNALTKACKMAAQARAAWLAGYVAEAAYYKSLADGWKCQYRRARFNAA